MNQRKKYLQEALDISVDFAEASDHPITCKCDKCRDWWRVMWIEDDPDSLESCPFSKEELEQIG
jgi:hypothetical protein